MYRYLILSLFLFHFIFGKSQNDTCLYNLELGISFPPVSDVTQRTFTLGHLNALGVSKIRFAEEWASREPIQGSFNWQPLDQRIAWADSNNIEILLTIQSNGPAWACSSIQNPQSCVFNDNNEFKVYLDSLLDRYSGKIDKIQFGNEWQGDFWYAGSAAQFVTSNNVLYQAVQDYSPSTQVVLGGFTSRSLALMAACNGDVSYFYDEDGYFVSQAQIQSDCGLQQYQDIFARIDSVLSMANYDIIDLHLYDEVERWDEYYYSFSDTITKPILVSEFGGPNTNYEPDTYTFQENRIYEYIKKLDSIGIQEGYFFRLVEGSSNLAHVNSGLIDDTTFLEKPSYYVFQKFNDCQLGFEEPSLQTSLCEFYPNPVSSEMKVMTKNSDIIIRKIMIYDLTGKQIHVQTNQLQSGISLDFSNISSGSFVLKIVYSNDFVETQKIIVQR
ncbi:MAG: T9SS type A sorting domain-containing protein [Crocinitomicaceae bacterium]|nr:T9SS type A sorting domain-containing protein [Crocinitomicaceae bacterium]